MKRLILFIASLAAVFGQGFRLNPITGQLDLVGGYTAPSGYSATVTAQTTTTVTAASHGQGTAPVAYCFDNASPANAVACAYTVSSIGDVVFTWSPAFTGTIIIRGPGADAGAAGNVVGPASSTAGALAFYSGTSGKVIASAGTGACYDSVNGWLGLGTCSPSYSIESRSSALAPTIIGVGNSNAGATFAEVRVSNGALADADSLRMITLGTGYGGSGLYIGDGAVVAADTNLSRGIGIAALSNSATSSIRFYVGSSTTEVGRFAPTTGNLLIGTTTDDGVNKLQVSYGSGSAPTVWPGVALAVGSAERGFTVGQDSTHGVTLSWSYNATANSAVSYLKTYGGNNIIAMQSDGGGIVVGGITNGNYKLDIAASGSSGTVRVKDATPTTGATSMLIDIGAAQTAASTVLTINGVMKYAGTNSTGAGSALLGANSPASTLTAPYTWITVITSDGSTGFIPVWK